MVSLQEAENAVLEKKYHTRVTTLCNNNCVFCLMDKQEKGCHKTLAQVKEELRDASEQKYQKLILSGGEPTIHPDIIEIVQYGKKLGFKKIQIITNGRMFSYPSFCSAIISAGLEEVTFSIHGHTPKIHDSLTNVSGSFSQIVTGIRNINKNKNMIVNADIVAVRQNYRHLPEIVDFVISLGIMEINLHSITPFGNAAKNLEMIAYDLSDAKNYFHEAIEVCKKRGAWVWTSRIPPKYLEGYEEYIRDSLKIVEEAEGMREVLEHEIVPSCHGKRCVYCKLQLVCPDIIETKKKIANGTTPDTLFVDVAQLYPTDFLKLPVANEIVLINPTKVSEETLKKAIEFAKKRTLNKLTLETSIEELAHTEFCNENILEGVSGLRVHIGQIPKLETYEKILEKLVFIKKGGIRTEVQIEVNKQNYTILPDLAFKLKNAAFDQYCFRYVEPRGRLYNGYDQVCIKIPEVAPYLIKAIAILNPNVIALDIPPCFLSAYGKKDMQYAISPKKWQIYASDFKGGVFDPCEYVRRIHKRIKVKGIRCSGCSFNSRCDGIFKKYVRLFGFSSLVPIRGQI